MLQEHKTGHMVDEDCSAIELVLLRFFGDVSWMSREILVNRNMITWLQVTLSQNHWLWMSGQLLCAQDYVNSALLADKLHTMEHHKLRHSSWSGRLVLMSDHVVLDKASGTTGIWYVQVSGGGVATLSEMDRDSDSSAQSQS